MMAMNVGEASAQGKASKTHTETFPVVAAQKGDKAFTLEDLNFGGNNYRNMVAKNRWCTWWGDELVRQDIDACYLVNKTTGKETKLFSIDQINQWIAPTKDIKVRALYNAQFPFAGKSIVMVSNGSKLFTIDFKKHKLISEMEFAEGESLLEANAQQNAFAYLKGSNLYVRTFDVANYNAMTKDKKSHDFQISTDGSREIVYGQSVHRDEFGISKGTFWSPNGEKLAFYRMDQSMVTDYPQVDIPEIGFDHPETQSCIATPAPDKYPMAGETSHKVTVGVFDCMTGKTVYLKAGDPTDRYFTNIAWSPDEKTIYMFELPRTQDKAELVAYDAQTGARKGVLYTEENKRYVEPMHPIVFLPWDDSKFIMQSRRDGWNHLYLFDATGKMLKQLTKGRFEVIDLMGFNTKTQSAIFNCNKTGDIDHTHWSVSVKDARMELLDNGLGVHNGSLSASGKWIYDTWSSHDTFRHIDLVGTAKNGGKVVVTNFKKYDSPWKSYNVPIIKGGTILAADGKTLLYYRLVLPVGFDASKKYPTVVYVYGGPHANNVENRWNYASRPWEIYMAQRGYIVFVVDNRGSQYRGFEFESCTHRHLGDVEMQDQMEGVKFLKSLPYVDANRLGVHGWSFGGFMTTNLMCSYPDVFKVGVAGGPVIDWKFYEVMYGERYMDTPQENPEGYESSNLLNKAKNLKGRLQIIVGYNDPTCVLQHSLSFLRKCEDAGTQPDYFVYPGDGHNMMGHDMVHLHERITRYFDDYLK